MNKERLYSVLKCDNDTDSYIFSTIIINSYDETYKYYYLSSVDGVPKIIDINNPIEMLKNLKTKAIDINDNQFEFDKFLAYKNLAEADLVNKMSH